MLKESARSLNLFRRGSSFVSKPIETLKQIVMKTETYLKPDCAIPGAWLEHLLCSSDATGSTESYDDLIEYEW